MKLISIYNKLFVGNSIKIISAHASSQQHSDITGPEDDRLITMPRYQEVEIPFLGKKIKVPDPVSCFYAHKEIFGNGIYAFSSRNACPRIIDCGANVGLSVLYFKSLFPSAEITAVEADPTIHSYLSQNLERFHLGLVEIISKAVSHNHQDIIFYSEGADGGRMGIPVDMDRDKTFTVESITLDDLIKGQVVDFLKIDIEGAETDVILESKSLHLVKNLFVEYHSFSHLDQRLHQLLAKLSENGYRYYISTALSPKQPFIKVNNYLGMDLQLNISCVRND